MNSHVSQKHDEKAAFATQNEATGAAVLAKSRYESSAKLQPYKCHKCDLWHLATKHETDE